MVSVEQTRIKGFQIHENDGFIHLVFQRAWGIPSKDVDPQAWRDYIRSEPSTFHIKKPVEWWRNVWPSVKATVNIALAKELEYVTMENHRVYIRIFDEIIISVYALNATPDPRTPFTESPYHPGYLMARLAIPVPYWNENIDKITDDIEQTCKEVTAKNRSYL